MNEGSNDLWQELSAMADAFGDLGRTMLIASRQLQNPGVLPSTSIDEQFSALRAEFDGLRGRACRLAESLGVAAPAGHELTSLKALVGLLELVSAAEASRDERAALTARAVAVLDRVLRLEHTQDEVFAPLVACQDRARALREAIDAGPAEEVAEQVAGLAEMDHPFGYLISLVEGVAAISDELWERLFESVGNAFGRPLSAAVARAKIVERAAAAVPDDDAEAEPAAPAAVGMVALNWGEWSRGLEEEALADGPDDPEELLSSVASETVSYIPKGLAALIQKRRLARAGRHKSVPNMERLETVRLLAANVISGFVYLDANNNGLFEKGETPVAADMVELVNSAGTVVGMATTDAQGAYSFTTDSTINTAPLTKTQTVTIPATLTNFSQPVSLSQFDPALGHLFQVDITVAGSLTSEISAENTSVNSPTTISSVVSGTLALAAPGAINLTAPLNQPGTSFDATTYDGTLDFGGTSGHDFGDQTAKVSDTTSLKTANGDDLGGFIGTGSLPASLTASATSSAEAENGNLMSTTHSSATATITITYHYRPDNGLPPGDYKIVQVTEPPGTLNGLDSRDGTVLPFNPGPGPDTISVHVPVTTQGTTLPNNDFGELLPAEISGFVYYDKNKDGLKEAGETGFVGIPVTLTGTNDLHQAITLPATTGPGGAYDFPNLRPGTYSLSEPTAPKGYTNGLATKGNVTPIPGSDKTGLISGIGLVQGQLAPDNDFGKLLKPGSPGGQTIGPPPEVTNVLRLGIHHQTSTIVIVFNSPLDPVSASDVANYRLVAASHGEFHGPAIPLASAVYDPTAHTVTLTPKSGHLNVFHHYQLSISGVKNPKGVLLDGNRDGKPGGTYVTIITRSNYPYPFPAAKPHAAAIASWVKRFPRLAAEWTSKHTPGLPS